MSMKPAIVVVGYNRPHALNGLLTGLLVVKYQHTEVPLVISIDGGGDPAVTQLAEAFNWPFGNKTVINRPEQLGLKAHILACGGLAKEYGSIILLEDDLEVSPSFYTFATHAINQYQTDKLVAGVSLYSYGTTENNYIDFAPHSDGLDAYLMQFPSSWGQAWTAEQWAGFEGWLNNQTGNEKNNLPPYIQRWGRNSWKKLFAQYLISSGKYFVYPKVSFTTNKGFAGTHFALHLTLFDVPLYNGAPLTLPPSSEMQRFNALFEMEQATLDKLNLTKQNTLGNKVSNKKIEEAEYDLLRKKGLIGNSLVSKWTFLAKYKCHNYINAIKLLIK